MKLFSLIIHYTPAGWTGSGKLEEVVLKDIPELDVKPRWREIYQFGLKVQQTPGTWEIILPYRFKEVLITIQPSTL